MARASPEEEELVQGARLVRERVKALGEPTLNLNEKGVIVSSQHDGN